ncbi:type IV secretion system protein [Succinivibrio faecicola]|uniref:Type IV secretion system protein n=1 Tax=Succinivibrio faecicola TaxID=2820300 RepID=A0ABS7DH05_9GAMM|nr:type IV secretion system protein [Succinivibrio faecicola]MBQ2381461.1 type IV secretion system protein [Succinivibrio sp.]MBW7570582.1 type IV secretion system protein [Succinivibrio faecicola]MCI6938358.1 type IV secretion system protein [Succinatimonas hippei]
MKRILSLCLLLTVLLLPGISSAQALNADNILSSLSEHFINEVRLTAEPIKQAATRLFFLLLPIAIVLQGLKLIFRSGNYMSFSLEMVKLTLITGIYLFLLNNGETIGISIVDSLCSIVSSEKQGPSELIDLIFNITGRISNILNSMVLSTSVSVMFRIITFVFMILLCLVVIRYCATFIGAYVLCTIGVIVLGFGAYSKTRIFAANYLKTVISLALSLMTYNVIFKATTSLLERIMLSFEQRQTSADPLVIDDFIYLLFTALFIFCVSGYLPSLIGSLVRYTGNGAKDMHIGSVTALTGDAARSAGVTLTKRVI